MVCWNQPIPRMIRKPSLHEKDCHFDDVPYCTISNQGVLWSALPLPGNTELTIFEQNSTEILSSLSVGQIVRISISVNGISPNPDPNVVRLNNCHVKDGERKVQIVENGEPVSLFSSAVWILGSETNTASFHFRVFTIGNAETGKFYVKELTQLFLVHISCSVYVG